LDYSLFRAAVKDSARRSALPPGTLVSECQVEAGRLLEFKAIVILGVLVRVWTTARFGATLLIPWGAADQVWA